MEFEAANKPEGGAEFQSSDDWQEHLKELGAKEGFYRKLGDEHTALFSRRGKTLVVTFENLDHVYERADDRLPWGYSFTEAKGWSLLGLMAHDWTWYRDTDVHDFFDQLRDTGFFKEFDRVIFYGASMGAYAACAFSSAAPGCDVIAISPQATLDRERASWETRYRKAWRRNYNDRYGYAPDQIATARKVSIFYDPAAPLDAMHALLFDAEHVERYKCRYMGHRIASLWVAMGVLSQIIGGTMNGTLTRTEFYSLMRARHETPRYQKEMLTRLKERQRHDLIVRLCRYVLSIRKAPHFRSEMRNSAKMLRGGRT